MENWTLTWSKLISFEKKLVEALEDNIPGVYRLSYRADDGNHYVFYISESHDIKKQLLEHFSASEQNICVKNYLDSKKCHFRYAKISKENIRGATLWQMYKQYQPTCNNSEPETRDDVKVNLT